MLEAAVAAGIAAAGGEALLGGVLPTPAAPLLIDRYGFAGAVVISASHNPYARQRHQVLRRGRLQALRRDRSGDRGRCSAGPVPLIRRASTRCTGRWRTTCGRCTSASRTSTCPAAGSRWTAPTAPRTAPRPRSSAAWAPSVTVLADQPDGRNINADCGSTHLDTLDALMREGDHDAGFAFDGDADRVLAVDRNGAVVDGDELIALAAVHLARTLPGRRRGDRDDQLRLPHRDGGEHGIDVATTNVGDRYVLEALRERGWALGGEQSGHIIDMDFVPSGDGIAAALLTLEALGAGDLADRHAMEKLPQTLVNVRVPDRDAFAQATEVQDMIAAEHAALEGRGRVLVRPSGTEPLVRVMVEAPTADEARIRLCTHRRRRRRLGAD